MTTKLYRERRIERRLFGLLSERPQAKPGQALVLTGNGGTMVLKAGTRAMPGEAMWGAYDTIYEVDMSQKEVTFTCSALAKGGDVSFRANFSASYRVSDPAAVVDRRIEDPVPIIRRVVSDAISQVTGGFDIEDVQGASAAVRESLSKRNFTKEMPFVLETPLVALELDTKAKEYLSKRREMRRDAELARGSTDLTKATADADRLKREYELKAMQQQQQGELEMVKLKAAMEAELTRQKVALELEMQKQRLGVYKPMIQEGMWGLLAQQLAQNPGDINRVTDVIMQMHSQKVAADVTMLQAMIQGDMIEDRHIRDVVSNLVQSLEHTISGDSPKLDRTIATTSGPLSVAAVITHYTDITCPRRVWVEIPRFSVVVRLTLQRPEYSAAVEELKVHPDLPLRARLEAPGFDILNQQVQEIAILPYADSPPTVFDLRPKYAGHSSLTIDFLQGAEPVGTVTLPVEVTAYDVILDAGPRPVRLLQMDDEAAPPDMVLHIATQSSPPALEFTLIRDGGAWMRTFAPIRINAEAQAQATELYRTIASLVDSTDPTVNAVLGERLRIPAADVDRRVRQLGQNLWRNLIPAELRQLYASERESWKDSTLLVFSDEPYLPWELVWPYDDRGAWADEGPWCQTLLMTRWLRKDAQGNGNEKPPTGLRLKALAVLAPTYSLLKNLAGAQLEQDVMLGLVVQHHLNNLSPAQPTWQAVMDLLEGGSYDWLHAAAHGNFYPQSPDSDSALWLQKDQSLTSDAFVGPEIEGYLHSNRPAFFFNACQVGRQEWALTRIGGWANRLVSGGASLFVGPLWEVSDGGALNFARAFYTALLDGDTVAKATRRGREAARVAGDPTWAAYSVYAHPNARVV